MTFRVLVPGLVALMGLSACSDSSSSSGLGPEDLTDGAVRNSDGTVTVMLDDGELALPAANTEANGQPLWFGTGTNAAAFESDDVLAVGGIQDDVTFSAIGGTVVTAPTGSLTYEGRYALTTATTLESSTLTVTYDADAATLSAEDGDFSLTGEVTSAGVTTGTVTFAEDEAPYVGGFFGADADLAAAFHNDTFGGVFYGESAQ